MDGRDPSGKYRALVWAMLIEEHPFHVLGVTPRSSRREILAHAEASSIRADPEKVNACHLQVTHPVKRVDAEVSWFPGVPPSRIRQIIDGTRQDLNPPLVIDERLTSVGCLKTFNAVAYWLAAHEDAGSEAWIFALGHLAQNLASVDAGELTATLNADRSAAGMPQITEISIVESAVLRLGQRAAEFLAKRLLRCPRYAQVLSLVVERDTEKGESQASDFISRFIDRYQKEVQSILVQHGEDVTAACDRVLSIAQEQTPATAQMTAAIVELEKTLARWGALALPIQLVMKSRGLKDSHSIELGKRVRSISVTLANDFDLHEEAQQITRILYDVLEDVPELAELLEQDFETLDEIINTKDVCREEEEQQTDFGFDDEEYCPECGRPMVLQKEPSGSSYVCAGPDCPNAQSIDSAPASTPDAAPGGASDGNASADRFVQLCRSIRLKCWQSTQANDSHRVENLAVFKAAYADYQRQVSPWLAIICDTYRGDTPVVMKARNAAAECLNSLAGGFICVNDLDTAQALCLKALPLVFDNNKLEAEIRSQLDFIASEKEKASKATPRPSRSGNAHSTPDKQGSSTAAPPVQGSGQSRFAGVATSRYRVPLLVAIGIAVLVAIPFLIHTANAPQWQPSVSDLTIGRSQRTAENVPPQQPRPAAPHVSQPAPEYRQLERVPEAIRELKPIPYAAVSVDPPEPTREPVSLPNGTNIAPALDSEGLGKLKISNYTNHDAAIKLKTFADRTTVRFVYVRAMSEMTLMKISPGAYLLQFATGRDWDSSVLRFRQDRGFAVFDKALSFTERTVDDGTTYSTHSVTLHAVPDGNVRKKAISAEEFYDDLGFPAKPSGR